MTNIHRIEVYPRNTETIPDTRGRKLAADLQKHWPALKGVTVVDVYTVSGTLNNALRERLADSLTNPVSQTREPALPAFDMALEIGFLPGVTDNVGHTATQMVWDMLGAKDDAATVYSSQLYFLQGVTSNDDAEAIAKTLANPLIQRMHIKSAKDYVADGGMEAVAPEVHLHERVTVDTVSLDVDDDELVLIGNKGIADPDGSRRGPLGLGLLYMQAIQAYFRDVEKRDPTDIELETLAQTWSEHCKHTIFADPIDDVKDGLYKHYIKRATQDIRKAKGKDDFCVSVFTDNSGAIVFDDHWLVTDKAETHNSPSALDPFGGAITGIVGVNRDTLGFGMGAKPVLNRYGYCFADPKLETPFFRDRDGKQPTLSPEFIMEGVVHGVNVGGNCSGIPSPQGFAYFDDRYRGKPLVFAGTVGLIPREVNGKPSHQKRAQPGDKIVMIGGRVGKDGIHGATFSSVALDEGSPATAVQIGDPITQKKFSDAIIREAREQGLYNAITDNGAGGLSSSVGEMAEGAGGFHVELEKVPLKYPGMAPWEIWISESQERMTLSVPPEKVDALLALMAKRDVEATVIGTYTDSGRAHISWQGDTAMDMSMEFLHDGLPKRQQETKEVPAPQWKAFHEVAPVSGRGMIGGQQSDPALSGVPCASQQASTGTKTKNPHPNPLPEGEGILLALLSSLNICAKNFIATQYDHEVQAGSVLKPIQGKGRVFADATVTRPVLDSERAIVTAQGIVARYSDIDTYHMAACAIDTAIRNAVATGANPDHMALMDNFCWCSSDEPERLYQLKRAVEACYDYATAFGAPFISGKDSMFNDFKGFDADGKPVKVSVPPTLLVSALSVIPDHTRVVSLDAKQPGDVVYLLGETKDECGASEYLALHGEIGEDVPMVDAVKALALYRSYYQAVQQGLVNAAIPVGLGGLGVALAKMAIAGQRGMQIDQAPESERLLFSESQSRIVVTVRPDMISAFEHAMAGRVYSRLGMVTDSSVMQLGGVSASLDSMTEVYHRPLRGY